MDPVGIVKVLLVAFVTLFPVVNPIGDAPIFLALTSKYPQSVREILARKIAAYNFTLLAGSFLFGSIILDFFGIRLFIVEPYQFAAHVCDVRHSPNVHEPVVI